MRLVAMHTYSLLGRPRCRGLVTILAAVLAAVSAPLMISCGAIARHDVRSNTPPDPSTPWTPPDRARLAPPDTTRQPAIPEELLESSANWTLADVVGVALRNNPATRATWAAARAAAANVGSERGSYYPQLEGDFNYTRQKSAVSQQLSYQLRTYAPSLQLQFILFDFGKRAADVEEAKQSLFNANWTHNAAIQNVVLEVEQAFYQYQNAKAVRQADSAAVDEARANLDASEERHKAGLATMADVLQARSNYAQMKLALESVEGDIQTIRGSLAAAMGLPPTIDYDIAFLPGNPPVESVSQTVEELIREAQTNRPDLAAAQATVRGARAHVKSANRARLPEVSLQGNVSRRYYDNPGNYADLYLGGAFLSIPLFTGFSREYDVLEAEARASLAEQQFELLRSQVDLDVWTSYYDLQTAAERIATTGDFLSSATESHDVALERYKAGVGTILELLAAQTTLEDARAQNIQARTDWYVALAQLAHATGRLEASSDSNAAKPETKEDNR